MQLFVVCEAGSGKFVGIIPATTSKKALKIAESMGNCVVCYVKEVLAKTADNVFGLPKLTYNT